jgi:acetamidase/formamidase
MISTNRSLIVAAVVAAIAGGAVIAQQSAAPRGSHDWASRAPAGKHHTLAATLDTVQWGWLDPKESPKLTVNSGDTISIETMMHSHDKVQPGITMEQVVELRKANPGGGPHSVTGPIFVNGAEPGDVLEIRILRIEPKPFAVNFNLPGKDFPTIGALASEMPDGFIRFFTLDLQKRTTEFKPGVTLDLQPFPGTFAVGIDPNDPAPRKGGVKDDPMAAVSTLRPWKNGSNMDINELQEGSTIFIPVFLKGGLIWTGDSHCRQGNGEVNLTGLECSYKEIRIQPIVRKDMKIEWPFIETRTHWISVGLNEDLNVAMVNATREAENWLANQKMVPMTRYEAYALVSMAGDCRVSQVVDVRKGVHCMIPKSIFTGLKRT